MGSKLSKIEWSSEVDLRNSFITPKGAIIIKDKVLGNRCTKLYLDTNFLGTNALSSQFGYHYKFHHLCVFSGPVGCETIGSMLESVKNSLIELTLSCNEVGSVGVQHLVKGIMSNNVCKLKELDLSFNCLNDEGAQCIAHMLRGNTHLKVLNVNGNDFTGEGASAIFDALSGLSYQRPATPRDKPAFSPAASSSAAAAYTTSRDGSALRELQCGFNPLVGDGAMESLARMLLENHTLVGSATVCRPEEIERLDFSIFFWLDQCPIFRLL